MKSDLINYTPQSIEYVLDENAKEIFPLELDFLSIKGEALQGEKPLQNKRDILKFVGKYFTSTFPDNELVTRKLDDFEKHNIREEYCVLQENDVPQRRLELEEALETAKKMKKDAEEAYSSVLMEVAKYAAEVKRGETEMRLRSKDTFCIALAGHYLVYTWDTVKSKFVLAKAFDVPDMTEIWANDVKNRASMKEIFGIEFPEEERPALQSVADDDADNLPFGDVHS